MIGALLRIFSYLYHIGLSLLLLGMAIVAISSRTNLHLAMLPWTGRALTYWLLGAGLVGLVSVFWALVGRLRFVFLLYAFVVFGLMFRGYFLTGYGFRGRDEFRLVCWATGGALVSVLGAASQALRKKSKGRR